MPADPRDVLIIALAIVALLAVAYEAGRPGEETRLSKENRAWEKQQHKRGKL
jgi:hypothetical protein